MQNKVVEQLPQQENQNQDFQESLERLDESIQSRTNDIWRELEYQVNSLVKSAESTRMFVCTDGSREFIRTPERRQIAIELLMGVRARCEDIEKTLWSADHLDCLTATELPEDTVVRPTFRRT